MDVEQYSNSNYRLHGVSANKVMGITQYQDNGIRVMLSIKEDALQLAPFEMDSSEQKIRKYGLPAAQIVISLALRQVHIGKTHLHGHVHFDHTVHGNLHQDKSIIDIVREDVISIGPVKERGNGRSVLCLATKQMPTGFAFIPFSSDLTLKQELLGAKSLNKEFMNDLAKWWDVAPLDGHLLKKNSTKHYEDRLKILSKYITAYKPAFSYRGVAFQAKVGKSIAKFQSEGEALDWVEKMLASTTGD